MTEKRQERQDAKGRGVDEKAARAVVGEVVEMARGGGELVRGARLSEIQRTFDEEAEIRKMLKRWIGDAMTDGVDFGLIPGTDKPTLLKPGAEKLVALFKCTPKFVLLKETEEFGDRPFFNYKFRVRLVNDAEKVLAEGFGSANSYEARYRWRNAARVCPECGKEAIIKGKAEFGGGWLCFAKKGGCGQKWEDGAREIESQELGKVENDDVATLANTILKMAKKRALVDGALALARVSDLFTQDEEDLQDGDGQQAPKKPAQPSGPKYANRTDEVTQRVAAKNGAAKEGPLMAYGKDVYQKPIRGLADDLLPGLQKQGEDWLADSKYATHKDYQRVSDCVAALKAEQARRLQERQAKEADTKVAGTPSASAAASPAVVPAPATAPVKPEDGAPEPGSDG